MLCQLKKAFQGSETKTRQLLGGTEEIKIVPVVGVIDLPLRQINDFKMKNEKDWVSVSTWGRGPRKKFPKNPNWAEAAATPASNRARVARPRAITEPDQKN